MSKFLYGYIFNSFVWIPRRGAAETYGKTMSNLVRNRHTIFHGGCTTSHASLPATHPHQPCIPTSHASPPATHQCFCCPTPSPALAAVSVLGSGHSRCVVLSYYHFNLQFPNDIWCQVSLCVLCVNLWWGVCSVPFAHFLTGSLWVI